MPTPLNSDLRQRISDFVTELDSLVRKNTMDALRGILDGGAASTRPGRPAGAKRGPRGSADLESASQAVLEHVRSNDAQGIGAIAKATRLPLPVAKKAAAQLLGSRQLKKTGQKRGTVYHAGSGKGGRKTKVA